jgi:hypothetical protein
MTLKIKFNRLVLVFPIFLLLNILSRSYGGSFIEPLGRVTTPVPKTNAYKYITDNAGTYGTVKMCAVSPTTGALSGCVPTGSVFINPIGINIDNSTGSSLAYISYAFSFSQGIAICQVSSATGALTGCTTTGSNMAFPVASPIANGFGFSVDTITFGGFANITVCQVSSFTGLLSGCTAIQTTGAGFANGTDAAYYNGKYYVTNSFNGYICTLTTSPSISAICTASSGLSNPVGISINNGFAYLTSTGAANANRVLKCSATDLANNPFPTTCGPTGPLFNFGGPGLYSGISVGNNFAYVSNTGDRTVLVCAVNPDGTFSNTCSTTGSGIGFNQPKHIY